MKKPSDFDSEKEWLDYCAERYKKEEEEYLKPIKKLGALVQCERDALLAWIVDGLLPNKTILRDLVRGDFAGWVHELHNSEYILKDLDFISVMELLQFFNEIVPAKAWGIKESETWEGVG